MPNRPWTVAALLPSLLTLGGCAAPMLAEPAGIGRPSSAERRFAADFDAFAQAAMTRFTMVPAVSIAVVRHDGPVYVRAFGEADVDRNVPARADTRFYIASSTKAFVGLAAALLDARGEIDLDWTLAELASEVAFAPELRASEVTLRHLLSHTHGLEGDPITFRLAYSGEHDPQTLWRLLGRLEPNEEAPLGTFSYGNIGYNVAGLLIERRLGRPWQEIVEREVLVPLGMRGTFARGLAAERRRSVFALPYSTVASETPQRLYLVKADETMQSAGGMYSTADDLARWLSLQIAAARGSGPMPLPTAVVAEAQRPIGTLDQRFGPFERTGYGLGWYSGIYAGETLYHAFGGFPGARAHVSFMPARDLGVAALTNDSAVGSDLIDLLAAYAYDWFADGSEAAARHGSGALDRLDREATEIRTRIAAQAESRVGRSWMLTLPRLAYVGTYCSADFGTLQVDAVNDGLHTRIGRLRSTAEPYPEPDAIRVELVPNSGVVLQFAVEHGQAVAVNGLGTRFVRCDSGRSA